jgi:hypothetical protein
MAGAGADVHDEQVPTLSARGGEQRACNFCNCCPRRLAMSRDTAIHLAVNNTPANGIRGRRMSQSP